MLGALHLVEKRIGMNEGNTSSTGETPMPDKEYKGILWIDDNPGLRFTVMAPSSPEARKIAIKRYGDGEGHVYSIWNEKDAATPR